MKREDSNTINVMYSSPEIQMIDIQVEAGFAQSNESMPEGPMFDPWS